MTYLGILCLFILPVILIEFYLLKKTKNPQLRVASWGIFFLCILALVYTTPWDNYLVKNKIWWYGEDKVLGVIGYVPIEEYAFFILQTILTGFFSLLILSRTSFSLGEGRHSGIRLVGSLFYLFLTFAGLYFMEFDSTRYLGLILSWASPVGLLQWAVGGDYLGRNLKVFFLSFLPPTIYLWVVDALAIHWGVWTISPKFTTGIMLVNLPVEEAIFFLMTNLMVTQGLLLFLWMLPQLSKRSLEKEMA